MSYVMFAQAFSDLNPKHRSTAMYEIVVLMAGAFLLGYLFRYLICKYLHHTEVRQERQVRPAAAVRKVSEQRNAVDDLTVVEGVGPAINRILHAAGIKTYADLAAAPASKVKKILDKEGPRFRMHDPLTWAEQALLADQGEWDALDELKQKLTGGR